MQSLVLTKQQRAQLVRLLSAASDRTRIDVSFQHRTDRYLRTGPQEMRWSSAAASVYHPFFFSPPPGGFRRRKTVSAALFYQLVYLCSMQRPQALQHAAVHCPPLIDKTCSAVCCTHRHFSGFWRSPLSLPACAAQGLCVRLDPVVNIAKSLATLVASFSFGNPLLRQLSVPQ